MNDEQTRNLFRLRNRQIHVIKSSRICIALIDKSLIPL